MFRRALSICTAVAAILLTAGSVVPSNAATRVGVIVRADVAAPSGTVRFSGYSFIWGGLASGPFWVQQLGSPQYFYGNANGLTFNSSDSAHIVANGTYNRRPAQMILDVTRNPYSLSFRIMQDNQIILTNESPASGRPSLLSGYVSLFAP